MIKRWIASLDGWPEKKVGQVEVVKATDYDRLHEAACCVANAIEVGVGGQIKGTLMEKQFRDALGLKPGEFAPADNGRAEP